MVSTRLVQMLQSDGPCDTEIKYTGDNEVMDMLRCLNSAGHARTTSTNLREKMVKTNLR